MSLVLFAVPTLQAQDHRPVTHAPVPIQIGTANLTNPRTPLDILSGLQTFMQQEGIKNITELIGAAL